MPQDLLPSEDLIPQTSEDQDQRIVHITSLLMDHLVDPASSTIGEVSSSDMFLVECVLTLLSRIQKLDAELTALKAEIAEEDAREIPPYEAVMIVERANERHW